MGKVSNQIPESSLPTWPDDECGFEFFDIAKPKEWIRGRCMSWGSVNQNEKQLMSGVVVMKVR